MIISLVSTSNQAAIKLATMDKYGFHLNLTTNISPQPDKKHSTVPGIQEYCQKLKGILDSKIEEENVEFLTAHVNWHNFYRTGHWIKLEGKLLEILQKLCGKNIELNVDGNFTYYDTYFYEDDIHRMDFYSDNMKILLPSTSSDSPKEPTQDPNVLMKLGGPGSLASTMNVSYCEDLNPHLVGSEFRTLRIELEKLTVKLNVKVLVEDLYLRKDRELGVINKIVQQVSIVKDLCIVAVDGSVIPTNKGFLVAYSPVFKASIEKETAESQTNQICSSFSPKCVESLLIYVYTQDIPKAVESSELAVELFQAAYFYEMRQLEEMLSEMMLLRKNSWFDMNAVIELFVFVTAIEIGPGAELKSKILQVLKSKEGEELRNSEAFTELFMKDWNTAMELCVLALEK